MNNILLIGSNYGDEADANGVCLKNIANEMKDRAYNIFIISDSGTSSDKIITNNEATIFFLKQAYFSSILKKYKITNKVIIKMFYRFLFIVRRIILIPFYPNVSPLRARRVYKIAKGLIKKNKIDTVIATYKPYESIYAAIHLKKRFKENLSVYSYHLDILTEPNTSNLLVKRFQINRAQRIVKQEICLLNKLILPENYNKFDNNSMKIEYTDFPVYISDKKRLISKFEYDNNNCNVAYIGSLNKENRNPKYAFRFLDELNKKYNKNIILHIWGNIEKPIQDLIIEYDFIVYHGLVENSYVLDLLSKADILLNITNQNTFNMLPSKIFQLFAAKRPIINFVKNTKDCSLPYFDKYGYACNIHENSQIDIQLAEVNKFIKKNLEIEIPLSNSLLKKCTPNYFVDLIERF